VFGRRMVMIANARRPGNPRKPRLHPPPPRAARRAGRPRPAPPPRRPARTAPDPSGVTAAEPLTLPGRPVNRRYSGLPHRPLGPGHSLTPEPPARPRRPAPGPPRPVALASQATSLPARPLCGVARASPNMSIAQSTPIEPVNCAIDRSAQRRDFPRGQLSIGYDHSYHLPIASDHFPARFVRIIPT
jgi:hypothetical protein